MILRGLKQVKFKKKYSKGNQISSSDCLLVFGVKILRFLSQTE